VGILTVASDPRKIVELHGRMQTNFMWLLRQYLEEKLEAAELGDESRKNTAALISFRREEWVSFEERKSLPGLGILVWAPSNYISVFKKFGDIQGFSGYRFDIDFGACWTSLPNKTSGWEFVTSHDSCWVNAMEDIIRREEDTIQLLCLLPAVKMLKLDDAKVEYLKEIKRVAQEKR